MKIEIGEKHLITSDPLNVILNERYEKQKDGKPSGEFDFKVIGYYPNLVKACEALLEREIRVSDSENLGELVDLILKVKADILKAVLDKEQLQKIVQRLKDNDSESKLYLENIVSEGGHKDRMLYQKYWLSTAASEKLVDDMEKTFDLKIK